MARLGATVLGSNPMGSGIFKALFQGSIISTRWNRNVIEFDIGFDKVFSKN